MAAGGRGDSRRWLEATVRIYVDENDSESAVNSGSGFCFIDQRTGNVYLITNERVVNPPGKTVDGIPVYVFCTYT